MQRLTRQATHAAGSHRPGASPSRIWLLAGFMLVALDGAGALGPVALVVLPLLGVVSVAAMVVGIRRWRPTPQWPWWAMVAAVTLFIVGGASREALGTLGELTAHRSAIPDLLTIPGYLLGSAGLYGMERARLGDSGWGLDALLDAVIAGLAALVLGDRFLLATLLPHAAVPLRVRATLACYPAMSAVLVTLTARLSFGSSGRGTALRYLTAGIASTLVGDVLYMLAETGSLGAARPFLDVPYGAAFVLLTGAALSPSMTELTRPDAADFQARTRPRIVLVTVALAVPTVLLLRTGPTTGLDRLLLDGGTVVLTAAGMLRLLRVLSSHAARERRLADLAVHDSLTGLPNRVHAHTQLAAAIRRSRAGEQVAVAFFDVDRFKLVNDTLGHAFGDEMLVAVAERIRSAVRPGDVAARIGGDEFLVVMHVPDGDAAWRRAGQLLDAIRRPLVIRGREVFTSASGGLALAEHGTMAAEELVRNADTAMYVAKATGRATVVTFDESMRRRASERLDLEQDLRHALARGELSLRYQPVVSATDGLVIGTEALLRWDHPERGGISPEVFIPIAEETGVIVEIARWVLDQACRQLAEWRAGVLGGAGLTVGVNVSAVELHGTGLLDSVQRALAAHGLPGSALCLELTESMLLGSDTSVDELLAAIRRLGVRVAVDDFGTGYSSLAYLNRFQVDVVKIDRSFVQGLEDRDSPKGSLVAAIVAMAGALGLSTVAEGVESVAQRNRLLELGCPTMQGFLFGRPERAATVASALGRAELALRVASA